MALPSTVYRATIELSDIDRGIYTSLVTTLARHPSETVERLVTRLLAYALFHESELVFTKGVCAGDEPDLWVKGADDRVQLWVEVGLPDPDRLVKAARHAGHVVLVAGGVSLFTWERQHLARLGGISNLTVIALDQGFISAVASRTGRTIAWSVTITEGTLYLTTGGESFETELRAVLGGIRPLRYS